MTASASTTGREAVITRVLDAPRELVNGFYDRLAEHLQRVR